MNKKYRYIIIGSGPTGLGAAYRLKELGISDFIVLEKEEKPGGLSSSITDPQGFLWDIGGHVQFSHYAYFDELMQKALGADGWLEHKRESWVWMRNRFIPYPFQNNIRYLPKEEMWSCLEGIIELYKNPSDQKAENFREWIDASFGKGIAEAFMIPYNFKVWAHPATEMSYQWIGERVAVTDLQRVTKNILFGTDDFSWGPNSTFRFPLKGGTGAIWEAVANLVGKDFIRTSNGVVAVNAKDKTVTLQSGEVLQYEALLSTVPLDLLTQITTGISDEVKASASALKHSATNVVGIGLKGKPKKELSTKCWMYFPESNSPYYRVTVFSNYSPNNVPDISTQWSLMTETSGSSHKPVNRETLIADTIKALIDDQLVASEDDIISTFMHSVEYGYPTPSVDRDRILSLVLPALEANDIFSRGRFGAWKYEVSNQDHSLMQGVEWVNRMVHNTPEETLPFPEKVNAKK